MNLACPDDAPRNGVLARWKDFVTRGSVGVTWFLLVDMRTEEAGPSDLIEFVVSLYNRVISLGAFSPRSGRSGRAGTPSHESTRRARVHSPAGAPRPTRVRDSVPLWNASDHVSAHGAFGSAAGVFDRRGCFSLRRYRDRSPLTGRDRGDPQRVRHLFARARLHRTLATPARVTSQPRILPTGLSSSSA
jgi:hypothetical protein